MENSKYYTPDLSEYHIGFEFEILDNCHFVDIKFPDGLEKIEELKQYSDNLMKVAHGNCKVKFLDKDDLESLGWKHTIPPDGKYINDNYYSITNIFTEPNKTTIEYKLRIIGDNTTIWSDDCEFTFFSGRIKNKSELKRILEQVGIYPKV